MKTAGIIGGMGPETTARFYLDVVFKAQQKNKRNRPPILMWNVPIEFKAEKELIEKGTGAENYLPHLIKAAKNLEKGGADFLVIPCNTVHVFIEKIRKEVGISVLSIVDETKRFLKKKKFRRVGLLATTLVIEQGLYRNQLRARGIGIVEPSKADQVRLGRLINKIVTNRHAEKEKAQLLKIIWNMGKKDVEVILLACTDLQLVVKRKEMPLPVFDSMDMLADATVRELLKPK